MVAFYNSKARAARAVERRAQARAQAVPAWRPTPPPAAVITPPGQRSSAMSTAALRVDAELRARIETLGITGGLFGDPAPGRSALDHLRAGIVDEQIVDRRAGPIARGPKITLAGQ